MGGDKVAGPIQVNPTGFSAIEKPKNYHDTSKTNKFYVQNPVQPGKLTGDMKLIKPLHKYLT